VICSIRFFLSFILLFAASCLVAAPPVPFSGKLAVDGKNFHGNALFAFSLVDGEGAVHWKHANEPDARIENFVMNGRYLVLLGGQGMQTLPADLFLKHDSLFLRVSVDLKDGKGLRLLEPDQRITSSPYALSAEIARLAEKASVADGVTPGAITAGMIDTGLLADLNRTAGITEITREMLPQDVRNDLNRTVRLQDLSPEVSQSINRSITLSDLDSQVITELNNSIATGSISLDQLSQQVRSDLNRTITKSMLAEDIKTDLNRTITLGDLAPEVIADLNDSIQQGSITLDMLSSQVRNDLNRTITKSMLSQEVLNELNSSSGGGGVVPGSLLAVPKNQSAPSGYSLFQAEAGGERKALVWEEKAPVSVARFAYDGVEVLGGKIYFVGGQDGSGAKNIAERYDPANNTWETLANMSAARQGVACAVLNGKLYAIGGVGLTSVEVFDPSNGNWSAGVALPSEVKYGTAITVDGKIYLIGGQSPSVNLNQVLCFDPSTSQWSAKANMPTARHGVKLVWFENRIWAIGGNAVGLRDVESYDPATDAWQTEASLITARGWPVAWVANGRIYLSGGKDGSTSFLNSIEVYDPATKQWASAGNFPENKYVADTVVLNDKAYVVAGQTATNVFSNKLFAADLNASVSGVFDLYRKDGNASSGVPVAQVADESIGISKLDATILKYLKPEITNQPQAQTVFADTNGTISVSAEGKYLTYQWKKNGTALAGETNATLTITDANATQHDGNYTVVVSNDFGSVESNVALTDVWMVGENVTNLVLWLDASREGSFVLNNSIIQNWKDLSGQGNDMNITIGNPTLTGQLNGLSVAAYDGDDITKTSKNFGTDLDQSGYSIVALSRYSGATKYRVISSTFGLRNWLLGHWGGMQAVFHPQGWVDSGINGGLDWHIYSVSHEPAISHNNNVSPLSSFWFDGALRVSNSGASSDTAPAPSDIAFGGYGLANQESSTCEVAEFIMVGAEISDSDRQKLEGYIAHKWGLVAILPSTHPYKN
jgi:N-acetylneuraminic acid mutarotase